MPRLIFNTEIARKPRMFAFRRKSRNLLATTRAITRTYTQLHKNKHFHVFLEFSTMSVHINYFIGGKIKLLAGFELASPILGVLGLAHYTTEEDIVILLPL